MQKDGSSITPAGDLDHLVSVLSERWVLSLATLDDQGAPYVAPLYFASSAPASTPARDPAARRTPPDLVFASSADSAHGRHLGTGPTLVAGSVAWETSEVGSLRGVQLRGFVSRDDVITTADATRLRADYLRRHPIAQAMLTRTGVHLYVLRLAWAKLTDNRLGIGVHPVFEFEVGEEPQRRTANPPGFRR